MLRVTSVAAMLAILALPGTAEARDGRPSDDAARVGHARRMVRALDDYDAQIARRQRQLKAEMRELERRSRRR